MARIKSSPRMPQPSPERQVTGMPQSHDDKLVETAADTNGVATNETTEAVQSIMYSEKPASSKPGLKPAEQGYYDDNQYTTCPTCRVQFYDMPVTDFREHVESCSPADNDDGSDTSELSEPPVDGLDGDRNPIPGNVHYSKVVNGNVAKDDDDDYSADYPTPYEDGKWTLYPEAKANDADDGENLESSKEHYATITDVGKFSDLFEDIDTLSHKQLYRRLECAQAALVAWQDEWIELEEFTYKNQPLQMTDAAELKWREKNPWPKNPRIGKDFPKDDESRRAYEIKQQGLLEASVYGYEYVPLKGIHGQDPIGQRLLSNRNDGRELRQRVPTQKAAEGELDGDEESTDENGKRRGRGQRIRYNSLGADQETGRGVRIRIPSSRVDSSRDQSEVRSDARTFASGKKIGRPRKNPIQVQQSFAQAQAQLLKQGQEKYGLGGYGNGLDDLDGDEDEDEDEDGDEDEEEDDDDDHARETTEHYDMSRPTTSSSMASSFGTGVGQNHSGKVRKRQPDTESDYEGAVHSSKRVKTTVTNGHGPSAAKSGRDESFDTPAPGKSSRSEKMKKIQKESWANDDGSRKEKLKSNMKARWAEAKAKGQTALGASSSTTKKSEPTKAKKGPKVKQEGEISAASRNMLNRWQKKREALALGLKVPNIGRYAKAKSVTSNTPAGSTTHTPEQTNPVQSGMLAMGAAGGPPQSSSAVEAWRGAVQAPALEGPAEAASVKKRGGRQKKEMKTEAGTAENGVSPDHATFNTPADDENATSIQKKGGKRAKVDEGTVAQDAMQEDGLNEPTTGTRGGRRKNGEIAPSTSVASSAQTQPSSGVAPVRTSGRVRHPTSRAVSSQPSTRPSTSHSHIAPTPTPAANFGQTFNNMKGQQPSHIVTLKTERGTKYASEADAAFAESTTQEIARRKRAGKVLAQDADAEVIELGEENLDEELTSKRRRGGRAKKETFSGASQDPYALAGDDSEDRPSKRRRGGQSTDVAETFPASDDQKGKGKGRSMLADGNDDIIGAVPEQRLGPEEAAAKAARDAKSKKMSEIMKARWDRGEMKKVMEQKKANNRARKAAALQGAPAGMDGTAVAIPAISSFGDAQPLPYVTDPMAAFQAPSRAGYGSSAILPPQELPKKVRKPTGAAAHKRNQKPAPPALATSSPGSPRRQTEYEKFLELASPSGSPSGRRARRPAALTARRSFADADADNDDDEEGNEEDDEEDYGEDDVEEYGDAVEAQLANQMSEFDTFKGPTSPVDGVILGKRKRKPVVGYQDALRIEQEDDEELEDSEY